jgi:hypothetical protein
MSILKDQIAYLVLSFTLLFLFLARWIHYQHTLINKAYKDVLSLPFTEHLIGEELITSSKAVNLSKEFENELLTILSSKNSSWYTETASPTFNHQKLLVQSKPVRGPLEHHRIPLQRASWFVYNCTSKGLFNFLVSPEGFSVIDPVITRSSRPWFTLILDNSN